MSKFKVGDLVRVVSKGAFPAHRFELDEVLRVVCLHGNMECYQCARVSTGRTQWVDESELELIPQKIVVTTDGHTVTARLFAGKELVKSAEAKCSPKDRFDFVAGAVLALDRLLDREKKAEPEAPKFNKADLQTGMFGCMNDGRWFVVCRDSLLYSDVEGGAFAGGYDFISDLNEDLKFRSGSRIDYIVAAVSFCDARNAVMRGSYLWARPGTKFK